MGTLWQSRYAARMQGVTSSAIREILKLTQRPDIISFAGGLPAAEYFPVERVQEACAAMLSRQAKSALQYSTTEGYPPLRDYIAKRISSGKLSLTADNILITTGSQQALSLLGMLLIDRGDHVLVEEPTYLGALQAFDVFGPKYIGLPIDEDGICTEHLGEALLRSPKFMYILPNFQNPGGVTLSRERRIELIKAVHQYGVPMVEDDPYGTLYFEGEPIQSLISLDAEMNGSDSGYAGNVIYLGTFSKTLMPGLRTAWVAAPTEVLDRLVQLKQGADLHSSTFDQMLIYELVKDGFMDEHVKTLRKVYRQRRDAMLAALDRYAPPELEWTHPKGGMFLWVHLPKGLSEMELFEAAVERNVAFVPGGNFFTQPDPPPTVRLNFSCMNEDIIVEGIKRLSDAIKEVQTRKL
jgi:2-aminoadipate transaminase